MTVKELKELLNSMPDDLDICVPSTTGDGYFYGIKDVKEIKDSQGYFVGIEHE